MPAFTFEKISPPAGRAANPPAEKKPRSAIGQMLDRFSPSRDKRRLSKEQQTPARPKPKA
jgi:hypothetical protein